ncbi:Na/Pi cotransporter family protein [Ruminococcus flavefaciens]|uniref:Na/Pi cotransporter family protein n=1 Tax=Ruminococcus flavefaciens TaxID=1265 RepID=UPI0026EBF2E1|nr:Na/Pi cotransporter family protein [Ruminococcus flavefaciens]MDD7515864.1 Na/Pi cotransporter family protein [Ruminococcus flavefaciens]MDY5691044.1 Na/Pi cotransporter family protein [Ruminococcus flavefaciens]
MNIFSICTLCGGLAFFLFGMHVMSQSLEKIAGGKLEATLKKMTSNPFKSLALGAGITIAVQSSSAMTVMLVGLVNSGIMQLEQTVGVIMGSNIGTTLTAWLLSTAGIKSDNVLISMLKPENFAPIVALIGIIMIMMSKKKKRQDIGTIMVGFAVLMFGMELMKNAVSPLAEMEGFSKLLVAFKNPLLSVLFGAVFTGIIQSSAASVGILQALSLTGTISYRMAIPIIMGQNIGTCVTALISSIGVNKNAKRVTVVHMSFNIIGTIICLTVFYGLDAFIHFSFVDKPIGAVEIAAVHSIFNIVTTLILLPFSNQLVKLAKKLIPDSKEAEVAVLLDKRLIATPPLAVSQCREKTVDMAQEAKEALHETLRAMFDYSDKAVLSVEEKEQLLDEMEDQLSTFLLELSAVSLTDEDSRTVTELLHTISDFERISDHAINMIEIAQEMERNSQSFSDSAKDDFSTLFAALTEISGLTVKAFAGNDTEIALNVEPLEEVIDDLTAEIRDKHIDRLRKGECSPELGVYLSDLLINCERVSDHCSNIAVSIIQIAKSSMRSHVYLNELKAQRSEQFIGAYNSYHEKYRLSA